MAENIMAPAPAGGNTNRFKEAVCIEVERIFDSCSDKDCLEDLQVFFTTEGQAIVDQATLIKCRSAEVMDVALNVEPVPFNKGFYAVDITFYFRVYFSTYTSPVSTPTDVTGLAYHCKKVILYGSDGKVKTFRSDRPDNALQPVLDLPVATLKTVEPVSLGARIVEGTPTYCEPLGSIPTEIAGCFDGTITEQQEGAKSVLVTLGLFTIVTLERNVQIMVPAYDYCVPEKDCVTSITVEDPCEMFKRIKFPSQEFFPETLNDVCGDDQN